VPVVAGCFAPRAEDAGDDFMDEDVPAGKCMSDSGPCDESEGAGDGTPTPDGCQSTLDCAGGEICAAVFDGDIGTFACRASCIEDMDDTRWCVDDDGCCNDGSVCAGRGYCMPLDATTGGDTTGAVDTSTGGTGASTSTGTGA